jgi:hypothetical protein
VRGVRLPGTPSRFGAIVLADGFGVVLVLTLDALGVALASEGGGRIIAVFLESLDFASEAALHVNEPRIFLRIGEEFAHEIGPEKDGGEVCGGGLEANLGEFAGVMAAKKFGEVILEGAEFQGALLGGAPFSVAAAGLPV